MDCPNCNHDVRMHKTELYSSAKGCYEKTSFDTMYDPGDFCECDLSEAEAMLAAQRAAAIDHLREYCKFYRRKKNGNWFPEYGTLAYRQFHLKISEKVAAYRAIGILKPGKE